MDGKSNAETKIINGYNHYYKSLHINKVVSEDENISLKHGDMLRPNFSSTTRRNAYLDAWVYSTSNSYPYGLEPMRRGDKTSDRGEASFPNIKEWRTESLMIHGANVFFWNWCVVKADFETHSTMWSSGDDFQPQYDIILTPGESTPCPEEPNKIGRGL